MSQVKTGEIFMDNPRIKVWPTLTRIYHLFIVKLGPSICMTWTWIKKVSKTVLSLVWSLSRDALSYLISCSPTVRAIGDCLSQRFSKNRMTDPKCQICQLTSWNCGTVLVIGLAFIALIGWLV